MPRPGFIDALTGRPLPELTPPGLTDAKNPPYSKTIRNQIADLGCHPLLESTLHLLNDDLFSAHFLLRKMQENDWGKWLHAILHQTEGDLEKNAKLWYQQVDPAVLSIYWGDQPATAAVDNMYRIMRAKDGTEAAGEVRRVRWEELLCVFEYLERELGWGAVDGTTVYTKDEGPHKSRVLGEGYRQFDKAGRSDR